MQRGTEEHSGKLLTGEIGVRSLKKISSENIIMRMISVGKQTIMRIVFCILSLENPWSCGAGCFKVEIFCLIIGHQLGPVIYAQILPAAGGVRIALGGIHVLEYLMRGFHLSHSCSPKAHIEAVAADLLGGICLTPENDTVDHIVKFCLVIGIGNSGGLFHLTVCAMGAESLFREHDSGIGAVSGFYIFCQLLNVFHGNTWGINAVFYPVF